MAVIDSYEFEDTYLLVKEKKNEEKIKLDYYKIEYISIDKENKKYTSIVICMDNPTLYIYMGNINKKMIKKLMRKTKKYGLELRFNFEKKGKLNFNNIMPYLFLSFLILCFVIVLLCLTNLLGSRNSDVDTKYKDSCIEKAEETVRERLQNPAAEIHKVGVYKAKSDYCEVGGEVEVENSFGETVTKSFMFTENESGEKTLFFHKNK